MLKKMHGSFADMVAEEKRLKPVEISAAADAIRSGNIDTALDKLYDQALRYGFDLGRQNAAENPADT